VVGTVGATVHALTQDETLKNLYAGYAFQYQQIAAYRSLIAIAEAPVRRLTVLGFASRSRRRSSQPSRWPTSSSR
jgi:hypothetical protein